MSVSAAVTVTMKTESRDGVCGCDTDDEDGVAGWCLCL